MIVERNDESTTKGEGKITLFAINYGTIITTNHGFLRCPSWLACPFWLKGMTILTKAQCLNGHCNFWLVNLIKMTYLTINQMST